ncbi:MAG: hypothetical protein HY319_27590 [Armatimonadetes bacterium]|nr:hypothetical protein [Armatimonadota bacterium]
MLGSTPEDIRGRPDGFASRHHLEPAAGDPCCLRPRAPRMKTTLALELSLDPEGRCEAALLSFSRRLLVHPAFEELAIECARGFLAEALGEEAVAAEELPDWLRSSRTETLERGGLELERSVEEGWLRLAIRRSRKQPFWKLPWLKR